MAPSKRFVRGLFVILLVAGCAALAIAPMLRVSGAQPRASAVAPDIVISEFRFYGPGGEPDEFIELFNRSCSPVDVTGWKLQFKNGATAADTLYTFASPAITTIQAGQYYLFGGPGYSGADAATANTGYTQDIDSGIGGVALFDSGGNTVDAVGVSIDAFHEGTPLTPLADATGQAYERRLAASGIYQDTNNNSVDFVKRASDPQNTSAITQCYTISGNVSASGTGLSGVNLSYTDTRLKTVTTDSSGNYTMTVLAGWAGIVRPSKSGYTFVPAANSYPAMTGNVGGEDYVAAVATPTHTPVPGYLSLVINEVAWAGTKASVDDKWIELYNPNPWEIDLTNWQLTDSDGVIGTDGTITFAKSGTYSGTDVPIIPAQGYFVIAQNKTVFKTPAQPDYIDPNLKNLSDCSSCGETLTLYYRSNEPPVDYANYIGNKWPAGNVSTRATMERHNTGADKPSNWYTFIGPLVGQTIVYDRNNNVILGTPGEQNWASTVTATPSPVPTKYKTPTALPPTPFGHMVINEFLPRAATDWNQDNVVDVYDEFIEVKNLGPINVSLQGWKLDSISSAGIISYTLPSLTLKPGDRAVFYRLTTKISLPDSGGTVRLTNTRSVIIDARGYGPVTSPDQSTCRIPDGFYWRFPCFPTPGNENSLTGVSPIPPPIASGPPPCLMSDIVPAPFRDAECYGYGGDMYSAAYWDDQSGFEEIPVQDTLNKDQAVVQ